MSTTVGSTSYEWMQFYEQAVSEMSTPSSSNLGFSDATIVATTTSLSPESNNYSPSDRHHQHQQQQQLSSTPKGTAGSSSKQIRRRSRASKKTPTTLLNADPNNFRALVQQFTGCPVSNRRGPVNLNFARTGSTATSITSASGYQEQRISQQRPPSYQLYEPQQAVSVSLFNNVHRDGVLSPSTTITTTTTTAYANDDHILDDFDLDNISLQELVPYSNQDQNDGNYFF